MNTREHMLNIAEDLFNTFGYTLVGVDLIRDKSGVSKTSIYRHFTSKSGLIEEVLKRRHNRFVVNLHNKVLTLNSLEEKLEAILNWHLDWFQLESFNGCMFMHALAEFKNSNNEITSQAKEHKTWLKSFLISVITTEQQNYLEKAEMLMVFFEGIIVRAEFEDVTKYKATYLSMIKALVLKEN